MTSLAGSSLRCPVFAHSIVYLCARCSLPERTVSAEGAAAVEPAAAFPEDGPSATGNRPTHGREPAFFAVRTRTSVRSVRKQYHFRPSERGLCAWDVDRLMVLVQDQPTEQVPLDAIREADAEYWFSHGYSATVRAVVEHARLINEADLSYPIIVDPEGGVMDGMHRVGKALLLGQPTISAKRLPSLPPPDFVDVRPDDLPYDP